MNETSRAVLLSVMLSAGALGAVAPAMAGVAVDINVAPPPPQVEVVPPPRVGFVWAPGFWDYRGHRHVWMAGRWVRGRPGYHWVPDRWDPRGPRWHHEPGHWER